MQVILHYQAGPGLTRRLEALSEKDIRVQVIAAGDHAGLYGQLGEADAVWHVLEPLTRPMIEAAPKLGLIQKIGVGVNTIDLEAARERDIAVCNMPGTNTAAVAEMTLLLMLACLRQLPLVDRLTREAAGWSLDGHLQDGWGEVAGRTVGLVGYGAIPQRLAPVLGALGADVIYWSRSAKPHAIGNPLALDELLATSDIISLHLPLQPDTAELIDRAAIGQMKRSAILINTARGGLVDETALIEALTAGRIAGAGLDVFADEPVRAGNPLLALSNVVLAPHLAWLTVETLERSLDVAVENCLRLRSGEEFLHRVV